MQTYNFPLRVEGQARAVPGVKSAVIGSNFCLYSEGEVDADGTTHSKVCEWK